MPPVPSSRPRYQEATRREQGGDKLSRVAIGVLAAVLALSGCLHQVRHDCRDSSLREFTRDVDQILGLQKHGMIDADTTSDLLALESLGLRARLARGCE